MSSSSVAMIDTSDIPEADEEWFKKARLIMPDKMWDFITGKATGTVAELEASLEHMGGCLGREIEIREGLQARVDVLEEALREIHDRLNANYPFVYTTERTTIEDFQNACEGIDEVAFKALYPDWKPPEPPK